jgi:hypothetical protein
MHCHRHNPFARLGTLLFAFATAVASAQSPWRSPLYPADWTPPTTLRFESDKLIQDFSFAGYHRGEVAIPRVQAPVFDVTTYGADATGAADSTVAIQHAIDAAAAAGGGVVYLRAGTFKVSPQGNNAYALRIAANNIVLRGAGRDRTFIYNDAYTMRSRSIIRVDGSGSSWATVPSGSPQPLITADLPGPTTSVPVASVAGFAAGDWILLRADVTDAFVAEHNMTDLWGGRGGSMTPLMFLRQITAIDEPSQRLTIDVPIRYYLKTRDNARVHKAVPHVEEVGLEDFSIGNREHATSNNSTGWGEEDYNTAGNGAYDAHASYTIAFRRVRNSWISNVASYRPGVNTRNTHLLSNGILLDNCRGVTVRNCDFQRALYGGGGGNGYMYRLQSSNECLVRDSAARYNRHGFVFSHMACSGNVIHGGIAQVTRVQVAGSGTTSGEGCDHHMHLSQSNLIDGVQLDQDFFTAHYRGTAGSPPQHGQTAAHSVFWNLVGLAYHGTKTFIVRSEQARYGYMIGTRGPAPGMTTTSGAAAARTAPVDHAEGAGLGATLQPLSLYHDQLARRLGTTPPPPVPTALAASAGVARTVLTWNASATATAYRVRRATTRGGPYTLLGTTGTTSYTDDGVTTGTTYHYVVSAVNAAGDSGDAYEAAATPAPAFQQDSGADGIVAIEAEHFDGNVAQGGHAWVGNHTPGFSGDGAMEAAPNTGVTRDAGFTSNSPRLDFRVYFVRTGTHHVWIRGIGPTGNDDSVHAGLNGAALASSDRITGFGTNWTWRNTTMDGPVATIDIPSAGVHTVNLWMREDGVIVDRIVLTVNPAYIPSGTGPAQSVRVGLVSPPPADPASARIVNLATRALVGGAAGTPIAGFVVGGAGTKRMLVRAVGPGLAAFNLAGTIPNPSVAVVADNGAVLASNDRWNATDAAVFNSVGAFALPANSDDAAVVVSLAAGPYTTPVGDGGGSGIALLEMYDAEPANPAVTLVNASTRAYVGTGDAVLIPAFVISGAGNVRLLVRAVGPTLLGFGVEGALADPELMLFSGTLPVAANANWGADGGGAELASAAVKVGAFPLAAGSRDAALLVALPAGPYTASVSGRDGTTGTALVEMYVVP